MYTIIERELGRISTWKLIVLTVVSSVIITTGLSSLIGYLGWGRVSLEVLVIGTIDSIIVPAIVGPPVIKLVKHRINLAELISAMQQEITNRKRAEEALRRSEERYRNFIEQSTEGIWMIAFDDPIPLDLPPEEQVRRIQTLGYVAECNDAQARMYGYTSREEVIGVRLLQHYGDYSEANFQATLKLVQDGYRSSNRETKEITTSGETVYFLNHAAGIIEQEQLVAIWGTQQDITPLKQAEQALRESEQKFRTIIEQATEGITVVDQYGNIIEWRSR